MKLTNYLLTLDDNIKVFGISKILKKVHPFLLRKLNKKIHPSTYYYWLSGKTPIPLKFLRYAIKHKKLWDKVFEKVTEFSVGKKRCILPRKMDTKLAYLIGSLHGDGSLNKNHKYVTLTIENKNYLSEIISNLTLNLFLVKGSIRELDGGRCYRYEIGSKVIHSFLSLFCPIGRKKGKLIIPKIILKNKELIKCYLAGLFDTDGCLSCIEKGAKSFYFVFTQTDRNLVYQVYKALINLKIPVNKPLMWLSTNSPLDRKRQLKQWKIYIGSKKTLKIFLSTINFVHPLKRDRANKILKNL